MGFAWLGLGVFFAGRRRSASVAFFCAGIVHGSVMGLGRMMQGGHFPSDVLGSALALYALSVALRMLFDAFNHRRGFSKTTADQGSVT
jgi:membrane-associated PAP2 superfamily phosphatase